MNGQLRMAHGLGAAFCTQVKIGGGGGWGSDTPLSSAEIQMLCWAQMNAQGTLMATMGGAGASARNHA